MKTILTKSVLIALTMIVFNYNSFSAATIQAVTEDEFSVPAEDFTVSIFPNPNNGKFDILTTGNDETKEVVIYNVIGEKVFHQIFDGTVMKTDISGLDKGLYMLQVYNKTQNKMLTKRFYIE